jgi:hypothetical protein
VQDELNKYLGYGWYPIEGEGKDHWVWSRQSCSLILPNNDGGFFLTVSFGLARFCGSPTEISVYDQNKNLLLRESVESFRKTVQIPALIPTISMRVTRTWKPSILIPSSNDNRYLGICLHSIEKVNTYKEDCSWFPRTMEIETTSKCNMRPPCVMCSKTDPDFGETMSDCLIEMITPCLSVANHISLSVGGEPLLTPKTVDLLRMINSHNTLTAFNTNGLLLNREIAERIIQLELKNIGISFDAATAGTYNKIRGKDFLKLKHNVKKLTQLKKERGSIYPAVCLNMVLMNLNIHEAPKLVDVAYEVGANRVFFQLLSPLPNYHSTQMGDNYISQFLDLTDENIRKHIRDAKDRCAHLCIEFDSNHKELWYV